MQDDLRRRKNHFRIFHQKIANSSTQQAKQVRDCDRLNFLNGFETGPVGLNSAFFELSLKSPEICGSGCNIWGFYTMEDSMKSTIDMDLSRAAGPTNKKAAPRLILLAAACLEMPNISPISDRLIPGFAECKIEVWITG